MEKVQVIKNIKKKYTGFESCKNALRKEIIIKTRRLILKDKNKEINIILKPQEYLKNIESIRRNIRHI